MTEPKFEDALSKLEAIVDDLESGELNLDDAIKKYEEGVKLSSFCYRKLSEIQKKVEVLVKDSSGNLTAKELDASTAESDKPASNKPGHEQRPQAKRKRPKGEELLF